MSDYYKFTFSSGSTRSSMTYYVISRSIDDMNLFLKQHGFNNAHDAIRILPEDEFKPKDYSHELRICIFKSNKQPGTFHVMTSEDLITRAIENTANDIADHSIFGEAILRTDIEFLKIIGSLIGKLEHGFVMDFNLADESMLFNSLENENQYKNRIMDMISEYKNRIGAPTEDIGSQTILQSLHDSCPDRDTGCIYPITVEAYVSTFTELMVDCYN